MPAGQDDDQSDDHVQRYRQTYTSIQQDHVVPTHYCIQYPSAVNRRGTHFSIFICHWQHATTEVSQPDSAWAMFWRFKSLCQTRAILHLESLSALAQTPCINRRLHVTVAHATIKRQLHRATCTLAHAGLTCNLHVSARGIDNHSSSDSLTPSPERNATF